jgi:hypothetical protein
MKTSLVVWGLVLLVGFYLSHLLVFQEYNQAWIWIGWAIIFNVGHYFVGKTMKKTSKTMQKVWMQAGILGLIITVVLALGIVNIGFGFVMTMWFLLIGAAMFIGGQERKDSLMMFSAMVLVFSSVFVLAFGNSYFLAGSLIMGLVTMMQGVFMEKGN